MWFFSTWKNILKFASNLKNEIEIILLVAWDIAVVEHLSSMHSG